MSYKLKREPVRSLRDVAYESMKEAILSGVITPGEKLTETDLSNQLGISRGPIREALRQLERDGLVQSQPYRGTVVSEFRTEEADQVYIPIRRMIEIYAFCRAADLFEAHDYGALEAYIQEMEQGCARQDLKAVSRWDAEFHRYVVTKCTSGVLSSIWESLAAHFYGRIFFQNRVKQGTPEFSAVPQNHRDLLSVMHTGDPKGISSILETHIL